MGKMISVFCFASLSLYIYTHTYTHTHTQGHEVDLRYGVGKGSWDKGFESILWISVSIHQDVDAHFLNSHALHLSAWKSSKNMRGNVTLLMESWPSFSQAAMMGPKPVCSRVTKPPSSGSPPWRERLFGCAIYQYPGMNNGRGTVGCLIKRVVKIWKKKILFSGWNLNPILLTYSPEITEPYWDNPLATGRSR